jgi:hypothetical protein
MRIAAVGCGVLFGVAGTCSLQAAQAKAPPPATVAQAQGVLDLAAFPLLDGAEKPVRQNLAGLTYTAPGKVQEAFGTIRKQLTDRKWKELPGGYVTDQAASATLSRDGYRLSLTVFPAGKAGMITVNVVNHGNVDLAKLPLPAGVQPSFAGPASAMFLSTAPVPVTKDECRKLLTAQGWQPYGTAGDVQFFKQNAVRLTVNVSTAPAQGGKTMISLSSELMSVDLPAPVEAAGLQYADAATQLSFETEQPQADLVAFYATALAKVNWKATTDKPIKSGFTESLIYRNPQKDMLTLEMRQAGGKIRVMLKHQTAAEVDRLEQLAKAAIEKRQAEKNQPLPKLAVAVPADAKKEKLTKNQVEFQVAAGQAKATVAAWRKQFVADGWQEQVTAFEDMLGSLTFTKGNQRLTVNYTDTGFLPAEVTLRATGVELERAAPAK